MTKPMSESDFEDSCPEVMFSHDLRRDEFVLSTNVTLRTSQCAVFAFFSDAGNLQDITPAWLNFRIRTPQPVVVTSGTQIDYSIRLYGVPIRWRTEIISWNPPFSFTDRQQRGPYRLWEHEHTFQETEDGTLMTDRVRYRVLGGHITNRLFVERRLRRIFEFRGERMKTLFSVADRTGGSDGIDARTPGARE